MFLDEGLYDLGNLRRCQSVQFHTQLRHILVVVTTLDGHLLHVRGIALDFHLLARLPKDSQLRKVREYQHKCRLVAQHGFVGETTLMNLNGINAFDATIRTIHIELRLIHVTQTTLYAETVTTRATG